MKVQDVLKTKDNWCKRVMTTADGKRHCLLAAICIAYSNKKKRQAVVNKLSNYLGNTLNKCIIDFNDSTKTTFKQVKAVIKELDI